MKIGYIRVSSIEQNPDRQFKMMKKAEVDEIFKDIGVSGSSTKREGLKQALQFVRKGDTLYIESLSRLSRSTKELLEIIEYLKKKEVILKTYRENIDTETATGVLFITILGAIVQFERDVMLERQREGIALAKAKGKYKGRKRMERPKDWEAVYNLWERRLITSKQAYLKLGISRSTFYKFLKEHKKKLEEEINEKKSK